MCLRGARAGLTPAVALPAAFVSFAESGTVWPGISLLCAPCRLSRVRCAGSGRFRGAFPLGRCKQIVKRHHPDAAFVERLSPYRLPAPSSWEIRAGKHRRRGGKSYCALKYMPDIFSFSAIGRRKAAPAEVKSRRANGIPAGVLFKTGILPAHTSGASLPPKPKEAKYERHICLCHRRFHAQPG